MGQPASSTPHRLDYRDLGYPTQNLIPADNSRITALLAHSNGLVYGATSGRTQSYLFFFNRYINKVRPLGKIAEATGRLSRPVEGKDGAIYIGTGLNMFAPVQLTRNSPWRSRPSRSSCGRTSAALRGLRRRPPLPLRPQDGRRARRYTNDDPRPLEDLGIPVARNTIYAMTLSPDKTTIYGLTYPDAHFFVFDLRAARRATSARS